MIRGSFKFWFVLSLGLSTAIFAEMDFVNDHFDPVVYDMSTPKKRMTAPAPFESENRRVHTEGITELSVRTVVPMSVSIKFGVSAAGSAELKTLRQTETQFQFTAENLKDNENLWDDHGAAVLVPGTLACQIAYRVTLMENKKAGLGLQLSAPFGSIGTEISVEDLDSAFYDQAKQCTIGPIPRYTRYDQIVELCKPCRSKILKTLEEDVASRMKTLHWQVKLTHCTKDDQCRPTPGTMWDYWTKGRCELQTDTNGSHFAACRSRSKIGGACPGEGSSKMFEYPCDYGLKCVLEKKGKWWALGSSGFSTYKCQHPKHPEWKKTPPGYYEKLEITRKK